MIDRTMPFRTGDRVQLKHDPRHRGRVEAVFNGLKVKVRWDDSGYFSEEKARELETAQ